MDFFGIFLVTLELVVNIGSLYQIKTHKGAVSWDFAGCNMISHLVSLAKADMSSALFWEKVSQRMCSGMSVLMVLLLLKYRDQREYNMPICIRWPVLVVVSVPLAWTMSTVWSLSPWYCFRMCTDVASMIPQGYILTKMREKIDNLSVLLFSMWMMLHVLNVIYLTLDEGTQSWTEPDLISYWAAIFVGTMPIIRFFYPRERLPSYICKVV